jgi:hypothetical protein
MLVGLYPSISTPSSHFKLFNSFLYISLHNPLPFRHYPLASNCSIRSYTYLYTRSFHFDTILLLQIIQFVLIHIFTQAPSISIPSSRFKLFNSFLYISLHNPLPFRHYPLASNCSIRSYTYLYTRSFHPLASNYPIRSYTYLYTSSFHFDTILSLQIIQFVLIHIFTQPPSISTLSSCFKFVSTLYLKNETPWIKLTDFCCSLFSIQEKIEIEASVT